VLSEYLGQRAAGLFPAIPIAAAPRVKPQEEAVQEPVGQASGFLVLACLEGGIEFVCHLPHVVEGIRRSSGEAVLNSTTLHSVLLRGAGTGGKTCPFRAMMATSGTVRRFRLPVAGCRFPPLLSLAARNNTRPASWAAKCGASAPFAIIVPVPAFSAAVAVLFPGPRSLFPSSQPLPMCSRRS